MVLSQKDGALAGSADLVAKLQALGALDNNKIALGAARAGMQETLKVAQTEIPVGTRTMVNNGRLVYPGLGKNSLKIVTTTKSDDGRPRAMLGVRKQAYYETQFLEKGTKKIAPKHWLLRSFETAQDAMKRAAVAYLQKAIDRLAKGGKS